MLFALALPLAAPAQKSPLGGEFQVNTFTVGSQALPAVAADADGDFVIAWDGAAQDGDSFGIFARRFSSAGVALNGELLVNTHTLQGQRLPSVAADADGDFVVVWRSGGGAQYDILARRFSSSGAALDNGFQVNTFTPSSQLNPAVAAGAGGDFVVAWFSDAQDGVSEDQDGSAGGIFAQRFSSAGAPQAGEFQVNTYTIEYQRAPAVATRTGGDFIVVWQSNLEDGSSWGVFARRFASTGTAVAAEFQVSTHTVNYQGAPAVALDAEGDFVVAWMSNGQDGYGYGVFARRFSSGGSALGSELQINLATTNQERNPSVAVDADGDFVVAWHNTGATAKEVFARRFSSAGVPLTADFQVNTSTAFYQNFAAVSGDADGDFVVAWQDGGRDDSGYGIFAQRFAALATLDVDGNGATQPLTDGLLVLRHLFGFTGSTLTAAAVDLDDCTRCDAAAIEPYLDGLGAVLDVDDSGGPPDALTDGLLALRFLFGFTGNTLVNNAVDLDDCDRCDALEIEPYLEGLVT